MMNTFCRGTPFLSLAIRCRTLCNIIPKSSFQYDLLAGRTAIPASQIHSSIVYMQTDIIGQTTKYADLVKPGSAESALPESTAEVIDTNDYCNWLPFEWHRHPKPNNYENSGDLVKTLEYDPSWPKPDFELSDELKTASDDVKYIFSLANASKAEIKEAITRRILKRVQRHPNDFDSLEVKIALKTILVRSLFQHVKELKKEFRGKRILHDSILKRNKLLRLLRNIDIDRFNWILKELKLYYIPPKLGGVREFYCKKWDLRKHTREFCQRMIKDKKAAYHEELKSQQAEFLKEKEETLSWIEKEEKEIEILKEKIKNIKVF